MKLVEIDRKLFREYDLRGIVGEMINTDVAYTLGRSYGSYVKEKGYDKALVGYDNRLTSVELHDALVKGIMESGTNVVSLGLVTTPMFYFGRYHLGMEAGVMITASHNPKEYNGFKMSWDNIGNAYGEKIQDFRRYTEKGNFSTGEGTLETISIKDEYVNLIKNSINLGDRKIKAVVDCGNGTASIIVRDLFDALGIEYYPLYCDSDGNFPNHHPDPAVEKNMEDLKKAVVSLDYDLGIGIDGDGDRVGIVLENGKYITADFYLMIMYRYLKDSLNENKALFDVKCSRTLIDDLKKNNITPVMFRTGNSYINMKMQEGDFSFGGEYSGHVYFRDKFPGFDDGLYAGLRLIELLSHKDTSLSSELEGINHYYSTYIDYKVTEENKFEVIKKFIEYVESKGYDYISLDGARVELENGWGLVRASNTSPTLTLRFEGKTEDDLNSIKEEIMSVLESIVESL